MEAEDVIPLPDECDKNEGNKLSHQVGEVGDDGGAPAGRNPKQNLEEGDVEEGQFVSMREVIEDCDVIKADDTCMECVVSAPVENGCLNDAEVEEGQLIDMESKESDIDTRVDEINLKTDGLPSENGSLTELPEAKVASATSGVKRTRASFDEQEPSVHVKYFGLSRESKHKLEELLREWSEWHARHSSRTQDEFGASETGEGIYFPALDVGAGNNSAVTFWMENEIRKPEDVDRIPVEDASVPLYDRGFSLGSITADGSSNLEGGSEFMDAPRCFNCSSYSHSMRECPKPRDNDAVNNSRKQLKSKRNQTAGMNNPTRYYQDTPTGKYEGLRPGSLDAETRRVLGLGEFDPPPWLNRMREIGYPPGYLEPEDEDLPSGITIFADEEIKQQEAGEILEPDLGDVSKRMSVQYPGINAPIPINADEKLWEVKPSKPDRQRNGNNSDRSNRSSETDFRGTRFREHNNQDFKDSDPFSSDRYPRYSSRYNSDHDFNSNSSSRSWREDDSKPRSPTYGRSTGERARNDPSENEDGLAYSLYSSFSYGSERRASDHDDDFTPRSSRDRDDRHRRQRDR